VDTIATIGSITKQFTAAAITLLESEGKLSFDDLLSKYFEGVPRSMRQITLHHLLTHSSGLGEVERGDFDLVTAEEMVELALGSNLLFRPGTGYEYSNTGYSLLAIIVEKLSGMGYETFLREKLFLPVGMKDTGYLLPKYPSERLARGYRDDVLWGTILDRPFLADGPSWTLRGNGGIHSTPSDMVKWTEALASGKVVPKASVERMFTPHVDEGGGRSFYGYGWSIQDSPAGTRDVWHNGGNGIFSADLHHLPEEGITVYACSSTSGYGAWFVAEALLAVAVGKRIELPPAVSRHAPPAKIRDGIYRHETGAAFRVSHEGDGVRIEPADPGAVALVHGVSPSDLDSYARLDAALASALETAEKGDFTALAALYEEGTTAAEVEEGHLDSKGFRESIQGKRTGFSVVGSYLDGRGGFPITVVRFHHEKEDWVMAYMWQGKRIRGRMPELRTPSLTRFQPAADGRLVAFHPGAALLVATVEESGNAVELALPSRKLRLVREEER
jgi:CubicO group peptidase (beta-lactamase class C family)